MEVDTKEGRGNIRRERFIVAYASEKMGSWVSFEFYELTVEQPVLFSTTIWLGTLSKLHRIYRPTRCQ